MFFFWTDHVTGRNIEYCTVASTRVHFKTHQCSISYPARKRFKTVQNFFFTQFINQLTKMTIPNRFQTEKIRKTIKGVLNVVWTVLIHDPAGDKSVWMHYSVIFSNRRLGFLTVSENPGHFWPLLATLGHLWPLLATFSHSWPPLATSGHLCWRINSWGRHFKRSKKKDNYLAGKQQPGAAEKSPH